MTGDAMSVSATAPGRLDLRLVRYAVGNALATLGEWGALIGLLVHVFERGTATVTASGRGSLLAVERNRFLLAVTGHEPVHEAAWELLRSMGHGRPRTDDTGDVGDEPSGG